MYLHSLTVSGLRCFRNPIILADFNERINIIYGPNECGKSTLIWGLILAFLNRHNVSGYDILKFRPWGTSLNPEVIVEFTAGSKRYRLQKGFLDGAKSILSEWDGERYLNLATGKSADEKVFQLMQAQMAGKGLTKNTQWGLGHLLWMPQDKDRFTPPALAGNVQDYFRQALGATLFSHVDDRLLELIDRKYGEIYTEKRGDFQAGSKVRVAEQKVKDLETKLDSAKISEVATKLQKKQGEYETLNKELKDLERQVKELDEQSQKVKLLKAEYKLAEAELERATTIWKNLEKEKQQIQALDNKLNKDTIDLNQENKSLESVIVALKFAGEKLATEKGQLANLEADLTQAHKDLQRAYDLQQAQNIMGQAKKLQQQLENGRNLASQIAVLESELGSHPLPGPGEVEKARAAQKEIDTLETEARTMGLTINFQAYRDLEIIVITNDKQETHRAKPGQPLILVSTDRITLDIPTVGHFVIQSGSQDLQEIIQKIAGLQQELQEVFASFNVNNVDELQEKYEWSGKQKAIIKGLKEKLEQILGQDETLESIEKQLGEAQATLKEKCIALGISPEELQAIPLPKLDPLKEKVETLTKQEKELKEIIGQLGKQYEDLKNQQDEIIKKIKVLETSIEATAKERYRRLEPYGGFIEKLQAELEAAEVAKDQKTRELEEKKRLIPENADALEQELTRAEKRKEKLEKDILLVRDEITSLKTQLDIASGQGLYSQVAILEEEYKLAEIEYWQALQRARAIKLLYLLMHNRRNQMLSSLTEPVRQEVSNLFKQITKHSDRIVELNPDLSLAGLKVGAYDPQPMDAFSVGTQEQLMVAIRLALGYFLSNNERQLVVLDDALVNTDADRRNRILDLLIAASENLQILILTCSPESYEKLNGMQYDIIRLL